MRFDYQSIDTSSNRLYISHMYAGDLVVFNLASRRVEGTVGDLPRVTGVWSVPALGKIYASVPGHHHVAVIDAHTLSVVARVGEIGFPDGIGGAELARLAGRQAEGFDAELILMRGITGSRLNQNHDEPVELIFEDGSEVTASVVLAAPGMDWRRLELDGIDELLGHGVYYGAGRSEAAQCAGQNVVVVGGGNSAGQAVLNFATRRPA